MILTCPSCGTQYAVKDGAIPEGGRKVRCAACGHSWHQEREAVAPADEEAAPQPQAEPFSAPEPDPSDFPEASPPIPEAPPESEETAAPATDFDEYATEAEPRGYEPVEPMASDTELAEEPASIPLPPPGEDMWQQPQSDEQQWDPEKEIPDAEEIRAVETETSNDRKRNWLMAAIIAILVVVAIVAALWFVAPDSLRQRIGLAGGPSPLQIAPGTPERQKLASGNELVMVSGRVINPSGKQQPVPPIQAELRDKAGKLLYSWTIAPPARTLPPGASATFNSAEMNVPPSGLDSTVTLTLKG